VLQGDLTVALDGSKVLTPESYPGRGCVSVTRTATEAKTKRRVRIVETLFGWKVLVLIDVHTRLPLAMAGGKIQDYEGQWLLSLVRQAQENLGTAARLTTVSSHPLQMRSRLVGRPMADQLTTTNRPSISASS